MGAALEEYDEEEEEIDIEDISFQESNHDDSLLSQEETAEEKNISAKERMEEAFLTARAHDKERRKKEMLRRMQEEERDREEQEKDLRRLAEQKSKLFAEKIRKDKEKKKRLEKEKRKSLYLMEREEVIGGQGVKIKAVEDKPALEEAEQVDSIGTRKEGHLPSESQTKINQGESGIQKKTESPDQVGITSNQENPQTHNKRLSLVPSLLNSRKQKEPAKNPLFAALLNPGGSKNKKRHSMFVDNKLKGMAEVTIDEDVQYSELEAGYGKRESAQFGPDAFKQIVAMTMRKKAMTALQEEEEKMKKGLAKFTTYLLDKTKNFKTFEEEDSDSNSDSEGSSKENREELGESLQGKG